MLDRIRDFFQGNMLAEEKAQDRNHSLQLATAALLFEVARTDDRVDERERDSMHDLVKKQFDLDDEEITALIEMASEESRHATCLFEFTRLVNEHYSAQQKQQIIEMCWHVAYSDGELDRYEEHYIRRLADLLYVPHKQFIAAKHAVLASQGEL